METVLVLAGFVLGGVIYFRYNKAQSEAAKKGAENLVCPHCQERGTVTGRSDIASKGISGGKASGAVLTGGASVLFTGLSKNQRVRRLHCENCNSTWDV